MTTISDLSFARENAGNEQEAINKYTARLKEEIDPDLRKATEFALGEEKDHKKRFQEVVDKLEKKAMNGNKYLEKIAGFVGQRTNHLIRRAKTLDTALVNKFKKWNKTPIEEPSFQTEFNKLKKGTDRLNKVNDEVISRIRSPKYDKSQW